MKTKLTRFFFMLSALILHLQLAAQWTEQNSGTTQDLQAVSMGSSNTIFAGGAFGLLLKSDDGGQNWTDISTSSFDGYVSSMHFISADTGYVHGWGQIYKTYDAGNSWNPLYIAPSWHYFAMDLWDEDHISIVGRPQDNPNDYWTTNTGSSGWNGGIFPGSSVSSQYHGLQYLDQNTILALRFNGISKSTDSGNTWTYTTNDGQISENAGWNEIFFINEQIGYIGASDYNTDGGIVYKTTDGGQTYTNLTATAGGIRAIYFIDENTGFVGCDGGYIYKTEDGGQTWYGEQHGVSTIKDIDFIDANTGCFVTETGDIYTTTNGGNLIPNDIDVSLIETDIHYVQNLDSTPIDIKVIIRNEGLQTLENVQLNYQVDNGTIQTTALQALGLPNLVSTEIEHNNTWSPSLGEHLFKIWVDQPNGLMDENTNNDTISFYVTVVEQALNNRNVLAEDATGAWCGWCPGMAMTFDTLSAWYNDEDEHRFIAVAQHNGDFMTTPESDVYSLLWSGGAFPSSWLDRFRFFGNTEVALGFEDNIIERLDQRLAMDAPVNLDIDINVNTDTRVLSIDVNADFIARLEGDYRLNCWILENGILSTQSNNFNEIDGHPFAGQGNPIIDYVNNHVMKTTLSDIWGDQGIISNNISAGQSFSHTYTFTVPDTYNIDSLDIVAFVSEYNEKIDQRSILNAQYKSITQATTSFSELAEKQTLTLSPNPVTKWTNLSYELDHASPITLELFDINGKRLLVQQTQAKQGLNQHKLDMSNFSSGTYVVKIKTPSQERSIRFIKS